MIKVNKQREKRSVRKHRGLLLVLLFFLVSFTVSVLNVRNVHIVITQDSEGDDIFNYFPIQVHADDMPENTSSPREASLSILKKISGEGWEIPSWENEDKSDRKEANVRWANFTSTTGNTRQMAIHPHFDFVSRDINKNHRWADCDRLPIMWNNLESKSNLYVEIGANIGSCVMEMLLSTNASIIAFEPHPNNLLCLKETISKLEPELQSRIVLMPVALGMVQGTSTIYSASNNMGNSVVGKIIKDYDSQEFDESNQHTIPVERLDSIFKNDLMDVEIKLLKLDAQGFECNILEGMGPNIPKTIKAIKFEWARKWLEAQGCLDLLPRLRNAGLDLYLGTKLFTEDTVNKEVIDLVGYRQQREEAKV